MEKQKKTKFKSNVPVIDPESFKSPRLSTGIYGAGIPVNDYGLRLGDVIEFPNINDLQIFAQRIRPESDSYCYLVAVKRNERLDYINLTHFRLRCFEDSVGGYMETLQKMPNNADVITELAGKTIKVTNRFPREIPVFDCGRRTDETRTIYRPFIVKVPQNNVIVSSRFNITFEIDDKREIVIITKGSVSSKSEFDSIYRKIMVSKLMDQMNAGYTSCEGLDVYDLHEAIINRDVDSIATLENKVFNRVRDYKVLVELK